MINSLTFDQALSHLRDQGIAVQCGPVDENGIRCELLDHVLTDLQIIKLYEYGRLNPAGIEQFVSSIKNEVHGKTAMPLPSSVGGV